jgi:peptidyl-Lys metalloendopeptidase
VTVTFLNTSSEPVRLLKWYTGGEGLPERLFEVTRDGEPVAYLGPIVKRAAPRDEDYVTLAPGERLTRSVALSDQYDLSQDGDYSVRYDVGSLHTHGLLLSSVSLLQSNDLGLWVEGRPSALLEAAEKLGTPSTSLSYSVCSSTQQTTIASSVSSATTYATNAYNYLNTTTPSNTARYKTWFGAYTSTNWSTAKSHYNSIKNAFTGAAVVVDCTCTDSGTYAYVYPTQPYKIYVCGAYWSAPMTGTDSKAGTLVHEMSHFNVVASTDDWAYGQTACKSLATSNPTKALDNADTHEYFAENTPSQL